MSNKQKLRHYLGSLMNDGTEPSEEELNTIIRLSLEVVMGDKEKTAGGAAVVKECPHGCSFKTEDETDRYCGLCGSALI